MGYQVLARKWRPKNFHQLVGQEHVSRALINALDTQRLHHAYLFTGTRGVGKTTLARILAKCLNCDAGISSQPCGSCSSCTAIDAGRFVDLIEVDAASRTKVEDTRELLDNVQYAPTQGRFKVYLIDEVHMLSMHSFNALLKTLEEPPPHVKFLLATTDPQKLPITVLSRCLQFQLKNMSVTSIVEHLRYLLTQEGASFEDAALWMLSKAADGSMRDALSLTDQALAYGQGQLLAEQVASLLGLLDQQQLLLLLRALVEHNAPELLTVVAKLAEQAPDFSGVLQDLASLLYQLTLAQLVPAALPEETPDRAELLQLAASLPAEAIQLYYQIAIEGRRDLPLAPDPRTGLEMTLMRMLAFRPLGIPQVPTEPLVNPTTANPAIQPQESQALTAPKPNAPESTHAAALAPAQAATALTASAYTSKSEIQGPTATLSLAETQYTSESNNPESNNPEEPNSPEPKCTPADLQTAPPLTDNEAWLQVFAQLNLTGWSATQIRNLCLLSRTGNQLNFAAPSQALAFLSSEIQTELQQQLQHIYQENFELNFTAQDPLPLDNISMRRDKLRQQVFDSTLESFQQHPHIRKLQDIFQAELNPAKLLPAAWAQPTSND